METALFLTMRCRDKCNTRIALVLRATKKFAIIRLEITPLCITYDRRNINRKHCIFVVCFYFRPDLDRITSDDL